MSRLKTPVPLGYSVSGMVIAVGDGVTEFRLGDRVACGGSTANHAEFNFVPQNLCVRVPDGVSLDSAACTTVGAIALQGVRQAGPQLGETVVVLGLGLVGQLCVALLKAAGCTVFGIDLDSSRLELALAMGAHSVSLADRDLVRRKLSSIDTVTGADVVLIAASSTSPEPTRLAAELVRDRGRIVVVGKTPLDLPWETSYEKELDLRMSRSYGPGRYDPVYEERGIDYPLGYVRWTEKRNMQQFLDFLARGLVHPELIVSHRFSFSEAEKAYSALTTDKSALAILLEYPATEQLPATRIEVRPRSSAAQGSVRLGVIGAGNFCKSTLLPNLHNSRVDFVALCAAHGWSASESARRFGFRCATTNPDEIISDPNINAVVIATRHDLHATLATAALRAGKAVFVEKPLTIHEGDLAELEGVCLEQNSALMVGYNRRFAPHTLELARWMDSEPGPWVLTYRVNAGALPASHWYYDAETGGGRLVGEVCHFIDLVIRLVRQYPTRLAALSTCVAGTLQQAEENAVYTLSFPGGSVAQVIYSAAGDSSVSKEKLEVIGCGGVAVLENFRRLEIVQNGKRRTWRSFSSDKGHKNELREFVNAIVGGCSMPIPFTDLKTVSQICFELQRALRGGRDVQFTATSA